MVQVLVRRRLVDLSYFRQVGTSKRRDHALGISLVESLYVLDSDQMRVVILNVRQTPILMAFDELT